MQELTQQVYNGINYILPPFHLLVKTNGVNVACSTSHNNNDNDSGADADADADIDNDNDNGKKIIAV